MINSWSGPTIGSGARTCGGARASSTNRAGGTSARISPPGPNATTRQKMLAIRFTAVPGPCVSSTTPDIRAIRGPNERRGRFVRRQFHPVRRPEASARTFPFKPHFTRPQASAVGRNPRKDGRGRARLACQPGAIACASGSRAREIHQGKRPASNRRHLNQDPRLQKLLALGVGGGEETRARVRQGPQVNGWNLPSSKRIPAWSNVRSSGPR